jgi:predicted ATP-binding protein involved in virulence
MLNIKSIEIRNLFGEKNYHIKLKDNTLILVAENGAGKTTIVNIIYFSSVDNGQNS